MCIRDSGFHVLPGGACEPLQQVTFETAFNYAWIVTQRYADESINQHFLGGDQASDVVLEFAGDREKHEIGQTNTIDGRNKGHGNSRAKLGRVGQVFHYVNQAHYGTNNADRWRVTTSRIPYFGRLTPFFFKGIDLNLQERCV